MREIPPESGVYVVRLANRKIERLVGESDILYIGKSKNLQQRIYQLVTCAHVADMRFERFKAKENPKLEVKYAKTKNYIRDEKNLFADYEVVHYETPPMNRQGASWEEVYAKTRGCL
jgi:F0F1-type ATP synthase gamma subunit